MPPSATAYPASGSGTLHMDEALHRAIRGLSNDFNLGLQIPDPTLSPKKRREQRTTEDEKRVDTIYSHARRLNFKSQGYLSTIIGRFRNFAQTLQTSKQATSARQSIKDPLSVSQERVELQIILLDLLKGQDVNLDLYLPKRPKRSSDEMERAETKRARSRELDDIPVRSKATPEGTSFVTSFNSSRGLAQLTSVSKSFSARATRGSLSTSLNTTQSDESGDSDDLEYLGTRNCNSGVESFPLDTTPIRQPSFASQIGGPHQILGKKHSDLLLSRTHPNAGGSPPDRLQNIWPKFLTPNLNHAPLLIAWELTRVAMHCSVDLSELRDLVYSPSDNTSWHNQNKFRQKLWTHPSLTGKTFPPKCNDLAWSAGLDSFQKEDNAVYLSAELAFNSEADGPLFRLSLNPPMLDHSHRLGRRFGHDRFLEILMPSLDSLQTPDAIKKSENEYRMIMKWLAETAHYFLGRQWAPFFARGFKKTISVTESPFASSRETREVHMNRVYFFALHGNSFQKSLGGLPPATEAPCLDSRTQMHRHDLLEWAIGIKQTASQALPKLFSRLQLSLTKSVPAVKLEKYQIRIQKEDLKDTGDAMNDGIGQMSRGLARKIAEKLHLDEAPCAIQGRLGNAKGMWIVDVQDNGLDDEIWIETYPSQQKWECSFEDQHHRTLEIKKVVGTLKPASLNRQFIPVLEARAIDANRMRRAIAGHLVESLRTQIECQKSAMGYSPEFRSWIQRTGKQSGPEPMTFLGGFPKYDEDRLTYMLDAGFSVTENQYMHDLARGIQTKNAERLKKKLNITVPRSTYAYMVIDFTGTLAENEVHMAFSNKFQVNGESETLLEGIDLLVARAPAHFESDIQKVRAVFKPELKRLKDVIVFSSKGKSSLADMLSGGDYDGDLAWVCWDQEIVNNFQGVPVPDKPNLEKRGYMSKSAATFQSLLEECGDLETTCMEFLRAGLSLSLKQSLLGICTSFKESLCYFENSVSSERAVTLSTLLSHLVDQSKQGLVFSLADFGRLKADMNMKVMKPAYELERSDSYRRRDGSVHILDHLKFEVARDAIDQALTDFENELKAMKPVLKDADLVSFFDALKGKREFCKPFDMIVTHLEKELNALGETWSKMMAEKGVDFDLKVHQLYEKWRSIQPPAGVESTEIAWMLRQDWKPDDNWTEWELLKASATFKIACSWKRKMPWILAGRQLAYLKGMASGKPGSAGSAVLVTAEMWNMLKPDRKRVATMAAKRDDDGSLATVEDLMRLNDEAGRMPDDDASF